MNDGNTSKLSFKIFAHKTQPLCFTINFLGFRSTSVFRLGGWSQDADMCIFVGRGWGGDHAAPWTHGLNYGREIGPGVGREIGRGAGREVGREVGGEVGHENGREV